MYETLEEEFSSMELIKKKNSGIRKDFVLIFVNKSQLNDMV